MKEEKDALLYVQFITKFIQHVGALDTAVRDVSTQEVLQTIKDRNCKYIIGVDEDESNDDDVVGPIDVTRTFDRTELTKAVLRHHFQMLQQHDRGTCINTGCIHRGK